MNAINTYADLRANRSEADDLVRKHAELVRRIAYHLCARLPPSVEVDDLIQAGMIGLLEAAGQFTAGRGASFETYAGIRIRGAMLDSLRRLDWAPRSVHRRSREVAQAILAIEQATGSEASAADVAGRMGVTLDEYHKIVQDAATCQLSSIEDVEVDHPAGEFVDPMNSIADSGFRAALAEAIDGLPEREKLVMSLYYQDELNLKEIGAIIGVNESRVSQILKVTLGDLRSKLTNP